MGNFNKSYIEEDCINVYEMGCKKAERDVLSALHIFIVGLVFG